MPILVTIILTGIGLSMDAFSLAILYGTLNLSKKKIMSLSIIVGLFHFVMPILGYLLGNFFLTRIKLDPEILIGVIFGVIAVQMIISLFKEEEVNTLSGLLSLLLFGFTVSIDSFSVGIGLGTLKGPLLLSTTIFSIISAVFTYLGLSIGNKLSKKFGKLSTLLGSIILFFLALTHLFQ